MKKRILFVFTALFFMYVTHAVTHTIVVGQGNSLTFSPSTLNVVVGDVVRFEWISGNHTTTSLTIPSGADSWNSVISSSVTVFDYTVTTAGTYQYQCNPHGGGGMTGSFTASTNTSTGVAKSNLFSSENVLLSPNPAASAANMTITINQNFKGSIEIFSAQGVRVSDFPVKLTVGVNVISLPTDKLSNGLYYVNITDKQDALFVTKLIVSN